MRKIHRDSRRRHFYQLRLITASDLELLALSLTPGANFRAEPTELDPSCRFLLFHLFISSLPLFPAFLGSGRCVDACIFDSFSARQRRSARFKTFGVQMDVNNFDDLHF